MAWTTPKTWASGYVVLAADLNTHLRDNLNVTAPAVMTTAGDILYASGANTPARLAKSTTSTQYLANTGTSNIPAWNEVALATGVSGTLPVGNGGTGQTSLTTGAILIGNATSGVTMVTQTTKGQILIGDGSGPPRMLAVGSNDEVLVADSGETTGVKWAVFSGTQSSQSALEGETDENTYAPPDRIKYSPGVAKCWGQVDFNLVPGNFTESYNMSSFTDSGTGTGICYIATDFSSANYAMATSAIIAGDYRCSVGTENVGSFTIDVMNGAGTKVDTVCSVACFGDQS